MPIVFAGMYLVAIPAFAVIYLFMWQDLRQSTASSDPATETLSREAAAGLHDYLIAIVPDDEVALTKFVMRPPVVNGPVAENTSQVVFYRTAVALDTDSNALICHVRYELQTAPEAVEQEKGFAEVPVRLTFLPSRCAELYDQRLRSSEQVFTEWKMLAKEPTAGIIDGKITVTEDVFGPLQDYVTARTGRPVPVKGGFGRFLYFSAATITTVGYGDIVPASDAARLTAASESVLGIVLAGLFINAVALRAAKPSA